MRKTLLFLLLLSTKLTFAQLNEAFTDGNFTANPTWIGTTSSFQITDGVLQSDGPQVTSTLYLSTPNSVANNAFWEFYLNLAFDPSTANYPRIYLISNQSDLSSTVGMQAYYLQLGATGSADNFTLVRQNGSTSTTILALPDKPRSTASIIGVRVRVERTATGRWDIFTDLTGGRNFTHDGFVVDNTYTNTNYFGVYCRYSTASRYNLFKFDDFKIEEYIDNAAPVITAVQSFADNIFDVTFNEQIDQTSAAIAANYSIAGLGMPSSVALLGANQVRLNYANAVVSGNYTLLVENLADIKGNTSAAAQTFNFRHIKSYVAKRGDIVLNEIMAAPISSATVLNREYVELWNTSDQYIITTGWKFKDANSAGLSLPPDTLAPKAYRILTAAADVNLFKTYGRTVGLSPWPSLNNDKDELTLLLPDGTTIIDQVFYTDSWYQDHTKKTGYALELINANSPCGGAFNWIASTAENKGTPGAINSVYNSMHTDNVAPRLLGVIILSPLSIQVDFNKSINLTQLTDVNNYHINNSLGKPVAAEVVGINGSSVKLTLGNPIITGVESLLTVINLVNCAGLPIDPDTNTAVILMTPAIKLNDILISEILFNPATDGVDYVEVYNATERTLDLKELTISNSAATGSGATKRMLTFNSAFISPKTYWVLTANPEVVKQNYNVKNPKQMLMVSGLPSYSNESGTVALWKSDELIDEVAYTEKMHHALLKDLKGVSLERVSFLKSGNDVGNLQSAAASAGFGTPTYQNSQFEDANVKNLIILDSKTFSPDNDGFEDVLSIDYKFKENGNLVSINIFTDKGILVRRLTRNTTLSTQGTLSWDGLNDSGQLCKLGIYVLKINIFATSGSTDSLTRTCVLAGKLN